MQNTLFLSFFLPQGEHHSDQLSKVKSSWSEEWICLRNTELIYILQKTVFLFSFSCHCCLNSIKFHAWGIKKKFFWSIFTQSEHSLFAENTEAFSWMFFLFDIELTFQHFTGYCFKTVNVFLIVGFLFYIYSHGKNGKYP